MSDTVSFIERVKRLGLKPSQFVVIGSGVMDAQGLRRAEDIDLVVTEALFAELAGRDTLTLAERHGEAVVFGDINGEKVEVWRGWTTTDLQHTADLDYLLRHSTDIDGVRLVSLEYVEAWKRSAGRTKDLRDLELLTEHRKGRDND